MMAGLGIGALLLCMGTLGVWSWSMGTRSKAREGWNLKPVVVAAVDFAAGDEVTFEIISQRSVPEQFVTASIIKPDSAYHVVNQVTLVDLAQGDPLRWADFEKRDEPVKDP